MAMLTRTPGEEMEERPQDKRISHQSAAGTKARAVAASAIAVVLVRLAVSSDDAAPPLAHHLHRRGLPHALCAPGAHTVILDDDSSLSWRQLQVHPVAYRDTSHRCDSTARTGVGGGSVWLRLPGVLPTQPMRAVGGACGTAGAAWLSGWAPGVGSSPPVDFHAPGAYPGDGPQDPDSFAAQQVICFERERPAAVPRPPHRARGVGTMQPGVLWEAWPIQSNTLRALQREPDFPNSPATQLLVQPGETPDIEDSPTEFRTGGHVPVAPTTTFSQMYTNEIPAGSEGARGCVDREPASLARSAVECGDFCAADPLCRFFLATEGGRCCFRSDYDVAVDGTRDTSYLGENAFYVLRTRAAMPRDGPTVSAPFSILKPFLNDDEDYQVATTGTGTRMRTYFRPPATGNYSFTTACMGECEIWLAATAGAPAGAEDLERVAPPVLPGDDSSSDNGPAWNIHMLHTEPQWLEVGRYYLLVVIASQPRYASLRVSVAGLPVGTAENGAAQQEQQQQQQPLEVASMQDYLNTDADLRSDVLQGGEDGRFDDAATTYESCGVSVPAAVINCGDFLLWRLPDAPGCCFEGAAAAGAATATYQSEEIPEQSLGYCTIPWSGDARRRLRDGLRSWVAKWLGLAWWHSI